MGARRTDPAGAKAILLTGATGYLGSRLARLLAARGYRLFAVLREQSSLERLGPVAARLTVVRPDAPSLDRAFGENPIDLVVHCATQYGRSNTTRSDILEANLILPLKLLDRCLAHGVPAFLNTDTMLDKRVNHYSLSKSQFRDWLQLAADKVHCYNVALEHFYGPHDDPTKFVSWILDLLRRRVEHLALTAGEQQRDFIFIDDVLSAFACLIDDALGHPDHHGYQAFQLGTGTSVALRDFVELARELTGNTTTRLGFGEVPYRPNEVMRVQVDLAPWRRLGWAPRYAIREGLLKTLEQESSP